ncbi:hypothetical protein [Comamonas aquatilis]|uniref:hypothetical protein n=1 Tax=Comamonas aquatilis TaxID=1778406 RepID=UPI0039EE8629
MFTTEYIKNLFVKSPISWKACRFTFVFVFCLSGILISFAAFNLFGNAAKVILGENMAPLTIELIGSAIAILLVARAVLMGPSGVPKSETIINMANAALSFQAALFAVKLGCFGFIGFFKYIGVNSHYLDDLGSYRFISDVVVEFFIFIYAYMVFVVLTVDENTAPMFKSVFFAFGYGLICYFLLYCLIGRSVIRLCCI